MTRPHNGLGMPFRRARERRAVLSSGRPLEGVSVGKKIDAEAGAPTVADGETVCSAIAPIPFRAQNRVNDRVPKPATDKDVPTDTAFLLHVESVRHLGRDDVIGAARTPYPAQAELVEAQPKQEPRHLDTIVAVAGMAEPPLRLAVGADAIVGIRAAFESGPATLGKSVQRGRLAQQH